MKPILYESTETRFDTNGIGILADAISCIYKPALNGRCDITLQYPSNGMYANELKERRLIYVKADPEKDPQPFRIYDINKLSKDTVTVQAHHWVYDLDGVLVTPFTAGTAPAAIAGLTTHAVTDCPFTFYTDKTTAAAFSVTVPKPIWSLMGGTKGSILDVYGGEYEYDGYLVRLLNRRGSDRGVSIRYGKNLTSLEQNKNCSNCYTGVLPYYVDKKTSAVTMLPEKIVPAEGTYNYTRTYPLDMTSKFETAPTVEDMRKEAKAYMVANDIGKPVVSWKVEFVQLEQTEEYRGKAILERIALGDTVHVEFPDMDVSVSARAVSAEYDCLLQRYNSITLGSVKANLASTIVQQGNQISQLPTQSQMELAATQLTNTLLGVFGGSVRLLDTNDDGMPDTLYIADNPDPAQAVKVWRFNYEGWGASKTGYNGPYEMGATFEDGIIADFIRAGIINANLIQTGALTSEDGKVVFDLSNSRIEVSSSDSNFKTRLSSLGLVFHGLNALTKVYDRTLYIRPGRVTGASTQETAVIGATSGCSLSLDADATVYVGGNASEVVTGPLNPGKKRLFLGKAGIGETFTVSNTANYDLFAIKVGTDPEGEPGMVLAYKYGNTIHGIGGWSGNNTEKKATYWVSVEFSGDVWTLVYASGHELGLSTAAWSVGTKLSVLSVYGVI